MIEVRTYSIDELVDLTGFSQRNIAYYIQQGLLPKIGRRGRNTRYPQLFVERLRLIQRVRDLQDTGRLGSVTLPRIARVIWHLVERSGNSGDLPELDDRELQQLFEGESIPDERELGVSDDGEPVTATFGKSGPCIMAVHGMASINAEEFNSITLDEALERIDEDIREKERKIIKELKGDEIQVCEGRSAPYVEYRGTKANIPEDIDPTRITLEQCWYLLENRRDKPVTRSASRRRYRLSSQVRGRETTEAAPKPSLARSHVDLADPATSSNRRKSLFDRLRHKRKPAEDFRSDALSMVVVESDDAAPEVPTEDVGIFDSLEDTFSSETGAFDGMQTESIVDFEDELASTAASEPPVPQGSIDALEVSEDELSPPFWHVDSEVVASNSLACIVSPEAPKSSEEEEIEIYVLQARHLADKIERNVLDSTNDSGRQTEHWTRVPVTEHIELSVKGIEPENAELVESLGKKIRSLLGLERIKGPPDPDND